MRFRWQLGLRRLAVAAFPNQRCVGGAFGDACAQMLMRRARRVGGVGPVRARGLGREFGAALGARGPGHRVGGAKFWTRAGVKFIGKNLASARCARWADGGKLNLYPTCKGVELNLYPTR